MALDTQLQSALALLKQGPVVLIVDPDGTPIRFYTTEGIDVSFVRDFQEAAVDVVGVYDLYTGGDSVTFGVTLPESSMEVLDQLWPDCVDGTDGSDTYRGFGKSAGVSQRTNAKEMQIRPYQTYEDESNQIVLWKVIPSGDVTVSQKKTEPHTFRIEFRALPDPTQADGEMIGRFYAAARS